MAGGSVGGGLAMVRYTSDESLAAARQLADIISAGLASGAFAPVFYTGNGDTLSAPMSGPPGVAIFTTATPQPVTVSPGDHYGVVDTGDGPVSVLGGAPDMLLLAGSGPPGALRNVTYTAAADSPQLSAIVITDGNNLIQTEGAGGAFDIVTGSGDDTINILVGTATIAAGGGANRINLAHGGTFVFSTGDDSIGGGLVAGPADTVEVSAGNTSIDSRADSFLVSVSAGLVRLQLGAAGDTVALDAQSQATIDGSSLHGRMIGAATITGAALPTGDVLRVADSASSIAAGAANDTIQALLGNNLIMAGTGNDTLIAGSGSDTLVGGAGASLLVSGDGLGTTFAFVAALGSGMDTITGLKPTDRLTFTGYGPDPQGAAVIVGGNTVIPLRDGTIVTIVAAAPSSRQIDFG